MKTREDIVKKCIALLILALYFFMVSTYVLYLPKYTGQGAVISSGLAVAHLHKDNNSGNTFVQVHCAFKSVPENKRKAIDFLIKTAAIAFLVIFSGAMLPGLIKRADASLNAILYAHQYYYLSLHTLRI